MQGVMQIKESVIVKVDKMKGHTLLIFLCRMFK
jgi:hypothetical protein